MAASARLRVTAASGACLAILGLAGCGGDTSVSLPSGQDRQQVSAELARAAQAQGICYGWALDGGYGVSSGQGSNLGENVAVESNPERCPKWVRVRASVNYAPESSESEDTASIWVDVYPEGAGGDQMVRGLDRFGLGEQAFLDDPALSIAKAALALPLLAAEAGIVEPAPTPTAQPASAPPALAGAGSDFWRDRWGFVAAGAGLLLVAGVFLLIGLRMRKTDSGHTTTLP